MKHKIYHDHPNYLPNRLKTSEEDDNDATFNCEFLFLDLGLDFLKHLDSKTFKGYKQRKGIFQIYSTKLVD